MTNKEFYIDQETGELIEKEDKNDLVVKQINEIVSLDDVLEVVDMLEAYEQKLKIYKQQLKEPLIKLFKENNLKSIKNDYLTITYVEETMQKRVDNERLKNDGLYEQYLKYVPVSAQIKITKKGKND